MRAIKLRNGGGAGAHHHLAAASGSVGSATGAAASPTVSQADTASNATAAAAAAAPSSAFISAVVKGTSGARTTAAAAGTTQAPHGTLASPFAPDESSENLPGAGQELNLRDDFAHDPVATAYAEEAPLTFTARDDPRVVARLPLRFCDVLRTVHHQLEYRRRQATHQTAVEAFADPTSRSGEPRNVHCTPAQPTAVDGAEPQGRLYEHAHLSDLIVRLLPVAVGEERACKTAMMHPSEGDKAGTNSGGAATPSTSNAASTGTRTTQSPAVSPTAAADDEVEAAVRGTSHTALLPEQELYRIAATEQLLDYLFCPPPTTRPAGGVVDAAAAAAGGIARDEARREYTVAACLNGLREVPSDSVEYAEVLHQLIAAADARVHGADGGEAADKDNERGPAASSALTDVLLPSYVRQVLIGLQPPGAAAMAGSKSKSKPAAAAASAARGQAAKLVITPSAAAAALTAAAPERRPVVTATLRSTLDAVLPPRLFVYYTIQRDAAEQVQQQRRATMLRQTRLRQHIEAHPDDANAAAELDALAEALASDYAQMPVGAVMVVLERASEVQAPRDYLLKLEQTVDEVLQCVQARCCGRPIRLISSNSAQQSRHPAPSPPPASTTLVPLPPSTAAPPPRSASAAKTNVLGGTSDMAKAAAKAAERERNALNSTKILATPSKPVCTRTLKPPPAQPAAISISGGGSATVAATLNVLELNKQRTLVQLSLLGEELVRQATVDLPERGVLLRRLLDEAQLSLDARAILVRERTTATQEHLLDGQDAREAAVTQGDGLQKEVAELRARQAYVLARKAALVAAVEGRKTREAAARQERLDYQESLRERLAGHTERVKAEQDAARRGSMAGM